MNSILTWGGTTSGIFKISTKYSDRTASSGSDMGGTTIKAGGSGQRHNNISPCVACYLWKRKS